MIVRCRCQPEIWYQAAGPMAEKPQVLAEAKDQPGTLVE